jgi:hypothetical protein
MLTLIAKRLLMNLNGEKMRNEILQGDVEVLEGVQLSLFKENKQ